MKVGLGLRMPKHPKALNRSLDTYKIVFTNQYQRYVYKCNGDHCNYCEKVVASTYVYTGEERLHGSLDST